MRPAPQDRSRQIPWCNFGLAAFVHAICGPGPIARLMEKTSAPDGSPTAAPTQRQPPPGALPAAASQGLVVRERAVRAAPDRVAMVVVAGVTCLHVGLDLLYRPWAWRSGAADFGLADSFSNLTAVVGFAALMVLVDRASGAPDLAERSLRVIAPAIGIAAYEVLQQRLPWGTFDRQDLVWTAGGGLIAAVLFGRARRSGDARP